MKIPLTASICLPLRVTMLLYMLIGSPAVRAQDPFTRITSGPVASGINSPISAWGDFNNDGFQDLFVSTRTGPSLLYSNNGNGTFSQILAAPIATDSGNCYGAAWGDYDNDGFLDLFGGVNSSGNDWLYHNNGFGGFTKITTGAIVNSGGNANNCGWADYDNDGFLDLFVANSDQNDFLYHNNGDGTFTRITTNAIALKPGNSQGGSWADYDNDGWPDLFVSRVNEPNLLYHNEGKGIFTPVTNGIIVHDVSVGQGTSWGDYDNDGFLDLFVANPNARNFLYHNNGDGTFNKIIDGAIVTDIASGGGGGWADYDNDGYLDLFVANRHGANSLYHNNGDGTFARVTTGVVPADVADAIACAWADYDNDGFPDLFVTELSGFSNRFYRNNGNANAWLTLKLEGRLSNRAAIGAKVRVKATIGGRTVRQLREISGGGGLGSQNDLRAGFGLGDATNVEIVRVEWPSRMVTQLTNVSVRQFLTLVEPGASILPAAVNSPMSSNVTFTLQTDLDPPPEIQWRFNGVALDGETNTTLTIANMQKEHAGSYTVSLTNRATGLSFTTSPAQLTGPLVISQHPGPQNVRLGDLVKLSIVATGAPPIVYQWQKNGTNLAGATNSILTFTNMQIADQGLYTPFLSNSYGSLFGSNAMLLAFLRPAINVQPLSQSVVAGGTVVLSVSAIGYPPPLTYRWLSNGVAIATITAAETNCFMTLTNVQPPVPPNQLSYRVNVSNATGAINSAAAILTVLADADRDGLPDDWELAHRLNPNDPDDATLDADDDGTTNLQEYRAGTNPEDPLSLLRIAAIDWNPPGGVSLRFTALSNKTYTVQSCSFETGAPWTRIADVPAASSNRTMKIYDLEALGHRFYRLTTPQAQ